MSTLFSTLRGFTFSGKHNYNDKGVVMQSRSIQPPSKNKIKETVPFMNGSYDFSTVGNNGEITYGPREITVVLGLPSDSKERLQMLYSDILEWLMGVGQDKLIFDDIKDYYYMAEVEDASTFEEVMTFGKLEVKFVADPLKKSLEYVGSEMWDSFNFETDYMQDTEIDVFGYGEITIYNPGRINVPVINCVNPMTVVIGNYLASLHAGDNRDWKLKLQPGSNIVKISGVGHVKIMFRKELL